MKRYIIRYHNKTADLVDNYEVEAKSLNQAVLGLRLKRIRFTILTVEVSK